MSGPPTSVPVYDNAGAFQYEEESPYEEPPEHPPQQHRFPGVHQQGLGTAVPQLPDRDVKNKARTITRDESDMSYQERENALPLVLVTEPSSYEVKTKKILKKYNNACEDAFVFLTFPFSCLIIFLQHILRFILRGIVRPIMVDTFLLALEYVFRPLMNTLVRSLFTSMIGAAISLTDLILILIKPLLALCRSIRLVQITYVNNGPLQEV